MQVDISSVHSFETFGISRAFPSINIAIKAQMSMLNPCVTVKFGRISEVRNIYAI